ncbi:MAG: LysM peptidoglycan-binding domain-containing protein [Kiritimatiellia bacterium]|nr:LysM peptidoglycan-binding domain-containing protein [Kiritimatiellia bacterium]
MRTDGQGAAARIAALGVLLVAFGSGCETVGRRGLRPGDVRRQEDQAILEERIQRLAGQVEGLQMESAALRNELGTVRREAGSSAQAETRSLQSRIEDLERRLRESEAARAKDREEIVSNLSGRIAEIMQRGGGGGGGARPARPRGSGYALEHVVKPNESLSRIAVAYGVTVQAIKDENQMTSDLIRVGQTLYIPEK